MVDILRRPNARRSFDHRVRGCGSGRTMARIGLRMMPPFPSSPLSSVQRVFPSTAGRPVYQTVPYTVVCEFFATYGLHPPFVHLAACSAVSSF